MEFAVSALFLLVILLPGYIFQTAYVRGSWRWNSPPNDRPISEQIISSIITASILHMVWAFLCSLIAPPINLRTLMMFLLGNFGHEQEYLDAALDSLTKYPYLITAYFLILYLLSLLAGYSLHRLIRRLKWDIKYRIFRFGNEWFYLLKGDLFEYVQINRIKKEIELLQKNSEERKILESKKIKVAGVYITTVVHHSDSDYLYRGIVEDFFFDKTGSLDRIVLTFTLRRKIDNDRRIDNESEEEMLSRYYEIKGNYFVLKYSEMSTINFEYIIIEETKSV